MSKLDEERARLLGVLSSRTNLLNFVFPLIRREWPSPEEMTFEQAMAYLKGPLRKNLDYQSIPRRSMLVMDLGKTKP